MKRIGYILIMCSILAACKDESKFIISGEFKNAAPKSKVYLYGVQKDDTLPLDSTVFSEKGEFKFSHSTPGVDFFKIAAGKNEYMIIAKNGDDIKLTADLTDVNLSYNISGAREADKLQELNTTRYEYMSKIAAMQAQFDEVVTAQPDKRSMILDQMKPKYAEEVDNLNKAIVKFAMDNSESLAGFYAINMLNPEQFEQEMVAYSDKIKSNFNDNGVVTEFLRNMAALKAVQVGQPAPDFTVPGLDGKPVKLSDFKGKYLMLDFWASWCMPCRQENPNVVKVYNTYKDKNFTILSISLDKDVAAWKKAIADDHLTWNHAGELKDFEGPTVRLYKVEAIPSSFLIDPAGKIVAKNLRGDELSAFLNKTLR